jgi:hypothetical protein
MEKKMINLEKHCSVGSQTTVVVLGGSQGQSHYPTLEMLHAVLTAFEFENVELRNDK